MEACRFKFTWKGVEDEDWWVQVADPGNVALPEQQLGGYAEVTCYPSAVTIRPIYSTERMNILNTACR